MDLISKLEDLKNFGIDLKLDSKEAEIFYVKSMRYFFDDKELLYCIQTADRELEISDDLGQLATIYVKDSVLRIVPLSDNPYAIVMDVLEFVAKLHKPTVALYKEMHATKSEESGLESALADKKEAPDEDSDFDDEWI
jgi:hypothetical protein